MAMSGPVFVIDAQGQPLMPLAEAHARKLLRSGKAQRWPHPTLTVIQLTRVVAQPTLRPVLLGLAIYRTAAELFLLASGPHAVFPLLCIIVDLPRQRHSQRSSARRRQRRRWLVRKQVLAIGSVISTIWWLLPLSHIAILRTPVLQVADPGIVRRLRRSLTVDELRVAITTLDETAPPVFPQNLFALLGEVQTNPAAYMPVLVACAILPPQNRTKLTRRIADPAADDPRSGIGVVRNPPLVGIIDTGSTGDERVLKVPVAANAAGVTWRYITVTPYTPFRRWPLTPAVLLPLVPHTVQTDVPLLEKPPGRGRPMPSTYGAERNARI